MPPLVGPRAVVMSPSTRLLASAPRINRSFSSRVMPHNLRLPPCSSSSSDPPTAGSSRSSGRPLPPPPAPPPPVRVVPSSAAMNQKTNKKPADDDDTANRTSKAAAYEPKANYNPDKPIASILSTTIEKIDEQLDRVQEKPLSVSETMFRVADGPLGREASKVAQKAAKGVVSVGGEALGEAIKIGTPVAKKGAGMLFKAAVELSQESERRRKEEKKNKK